MPISDAARPGQGTRSLTDQQQSRLTKTTVDPQTAEAVMRDVLVTIGAVLPALSPDLRDRATLALRCFGSRPLTLKEVAVIGCFSTETARRRALRLAGAKQAGRFQLTAAMVAAIVGEVHHA